MLRTIERIYAVAMLFYMSNGVLGFLSRGAESGIERSESGPTFLALQTIFYLPLILFVVLRWKSFIRGLIAGRWVLVLVCLALASTLWCAEDQTDGAMVHSMALLGTTTYGVYLSISFDLREQLRLYAWTFAIVLVLSTGFAILLPAYGIDHYLHAGKWQGIFIQKNLLGKASLVSLLVFVAGRNVVPLWIRGVFITASVTLALLSGSKTALLIAVPILFLKPLYRITQMTLSARLPILIAVTSCVGVIGAGIGANLNWVMSHLGRDMTLTGRAELWRALRLKMTAHWLLGYGYGAFWNGMRGESADVILRLGWIPKHSHNGMLDLYLDLGGLGVLVFVVGYCAALYRAFHPGSRTLKGEAAWPLFYLGFTCLYYLTEGQMVRQNSLYWAIYVATVVHVGSSLWKASDRQELIPDHSVAFEPGQRHPHSFPRVTENPARAMSSVTQ